MEAKGNMQDSEKIILSLNLKEGEDSEYQSATVEPSTSVEMLCSVEGETDADSDLGWIKDGNIFDTNEETILVEEIEENSKTVIKILQFDSSHVGEYECTVKRPEGTYQKAKIRLDIKPTSSYDHSAFGEVPCEEEISKICQNNGVCYRHEESRAISCRCLQNTYGARCEYLSDADVQIEYEEFGDKVSSTTVAAGAVFSVVLLLLGFLLGFVCWKRTRSNQYINRNYDDFLAKASRASIRSTTSSNFAKTLEKKFHQAVERVNSYQPTSPTKKNCQNCALPYMRWSESALPLKPSEQSTPKSYSFEQISPKHTVVYMGQQERPQVHELNCCKFADIV